MKRPDIKQLLSDIKAQPDWRSLATKAAKYYDGEQLTPLQREKLRKLEMPDIVENLIKRPVNSMLGHEAQRRRDWVVKADDDDSQEVAEGLNQKLNETMRLCNANGVCSEAYASQIKTGIGWVHVRRNDDPFGAPYKIEEVHRDEIYWDIRGRKQNLEDARWLARRTFQDVDEAKAWLPRQFHELVDRVANGWQDVSRWEIADENAAGRIEARHSEWQAASSHLDALMDTQRKRVAIYEVYYRVYEQLPLVYLPDGRVVEYDDTDWQQSVAIQAGAAQVKVRNVKRMRRCWYMGPHFLLDEASPYPHDQFPYVPFFGYRQDGENVPYGIIRDMMDSQDAYTNMNIRIHHILNQKRIIKDENATKMRDSDLVHETNRKDGVITLTGQGRFEVEQDYAELHRLEGLRDKHKAMIQEVSGVLDAYTGKGAASQSGVAVQSLAELTAVSLAEINDNYEQARKVLAELVMAYLVQDLSGREEVIAIPEDIHQAKKTVVLNNNVQMARYQVEIAPIQVSQSYRQQTYQRMMEMFGPAPDAMKMALFPMIIESSDMPRKSEFLKKWNEQNGIVDDPEQQAAAQQQQQEQQTAEMQMLQQERESEILLKQAQAAERKAEAELNTAQAAKVLHDIEEARALRREREQAAKAEQVQQARRTIHQQQLAAL